MWTWLELEHFKCFERLRLPLAPLTLLTGQNAAGKSTVVQALVLLHQSVQDGEWSRALLLDGSLISLGTAGDVIDKIAGRSEFSVGLGSDDFSVRWTARAADRRDLQMPLQSICWQDAVHEIDLQRPALDDVALRNLVPVTWQAWAACQTLVERLCRLVYVSAERLGPRETYPLGDASRYGTVGARGERTAGLLHLHGDVPVKLSEMLLEDAAPTLLRQVERWMQVFFPGSSFIVEPVPRANAVTLNLRTSNRTDFHRPQHVGYGLTHILPVITACLMAGPGDVLAIENPEVHLHPAGQALVGRFLARAAGAGAQILLETHSDHVLNGIRRSVREGTVRASDVAIHFFGRQPEAAEAGPQVISPTLDARGNLDTWPQGFFDQFDEDLAALSGWS